MSEIKAIETVYNGYRFRSRSEARWAVFFDAIGIKYRYEWEGYDLGDGVYYLPDFYLPDMNQYFEVKPDIKRLLPTERIKVNRLAQATDKYVIIGDSDFKLTGTESHPDNNFREDTSLWGCDTYLVKCRACGTLYFENEMSYRCTACGYYDGDGTFRYISGENGDTRWAEDEYVEAITKAKQARFEHGEKPVTSRIANNPHIKSAIATIMKPPTPDHEQNVRWYTWRGHKWYMNDDNQHFITPQED